MGLGPIVLDADHRRRLEEAISQLETSLKKGHTLGYCLDTVEDKALRYDLLELLFRAQDSLRLAEPNWLQATYLVRERMLGE